MNFNCDIIITDPCYIVKSEDDWHLCEYGLNLEKLNITTFITGMDADRLGCNVLDTSSNKLIGEFSHDSCVVSVMSLSELNSYNPNFRKELDRSCYCVIRNFSGTVEKIEVEHSDDDQEWAFLGTGNINFKTGWA